MKQKLHPRTGTLILLLAILWLTGCGGDSGGPDQDYRGNWRGRTSHGGTVVFTVSVNEVTFLQIVDAQANVDLTMPLGIDGSSFSAATSAGVSSSGSPAVSVHCTFDSATHGTGSYSITKPPNTWTGTFEASRQ